MTNPEPPKSGEQTTKCAICGSTAHTTGYHEGNAEPAGYHEGNSIPTAQDPS